MALFIVSIAVPEQAQACRAADLSAEMLASKIPALGLNEQHAFAMKNHIGDDLRQVHTRFQQSFNGSTFSVVVSNSSGSITSNNATLTVTTAPPPPPGNTEVEPNNTQAEAQTIATSGTTGTYTLKLTF